MNQPAANLLKEIGRLLGAMEDVFSAAQWGGRAYKLPGPGGNRHRPKLLAFVVATRGGEAISVGFKLERDRAAAVVAQHRWIEPHSFRTLAASGWIEAVVSSKRNLGPLARLLEESRQLYPFPSSSSPEITVRRGAGGAAARRIDHVMNEIRAEGWRPPPDDEFDR